MAFPTSPTDGQTYTNNGTTYVYSAGLGVWDVQGSSTSATGVSSVAGRTGTVTLTASDIGAGTFSGAVTMSSNLTASGNTTVATMFATSAVTLSATLGVTGATTLASLGATTGTFSGALSTASTFTATGATTLSSTLAVTGATTLSSTLQTTSIGIGTPASGTSGEIRATNAITAFYSDGRLKTRIGNIDNALDKIDQLVGFLYKHNDIARSYGYTDDKVYVGLDANTVKIVQPEATGLAPFDINENGTSRSGENYLTVQYEKLIPLLVEGIKELRREVKYIKKQLK